MRTIKIDWKSQEERICYCRCGKIFLSKTIFRRDKMKIISKEICPGCNRNNSLYKTAEYKEVEDVRRKSTNRRR